MPTLAVGAVLTAGGVALGLRRMNDDDVVKVAVLSSAFFVTSLIHVPIGPVAVHLVLNGLAGVVLGWAAFPAILVGLLLQATVFGYGGITTLGVNTLTMALPAVACSWAFGGAVRRASGSRAFMLGAIVGAGAVAGSCVLVALALLTAGRAFLAIAQTEIVMHVPVMAIEAIVTGSAIAFLRKVRPEVLAALGPAAEHTVA